MNEHLKFALSNVRQTFLAFYTCIVLALCVMVAIQAGWFDFSTGNQATLAGGHTEHSEFALKVAADGKTIYTATENVSEAVREVIMGTVYPSPEAAVEAVEGSPPGNPAYAHAVNICTHSDGKVSNNTGSGRHLTWFRFHDNGRHYTATAHQVLSNYVWVTTETYRWDVSRSFCQCW